MKLALRGVRKAFGGHEVLRGVDLDVGPGELVCLIGPSGSGKSTLLRCAALLDEIDDGHVLLDGADITVEGVDPRAVHRRVGMVFQSFNLFPHLTALENVMLAPRRVLREAPGPLRARAEALLARFGLAAQAGRYPDQLSGGQQQRVALVRAVAMRPEVLLLDEITSALDPALVGEVLDALRALKDEGMTMLVATHEMAFAREAASRIAVMDAGRVVEEGAPEVLFTAPRAPETRALLARVLAGG